MAEIREISVVFIELILPNDEDSHLECMQQVLSMTQLLLICKHDGILRQMMVDDKGCVIICGFGTPGTNSILREQRAVLACWELLKAVEEDNAVDVKLAIGVATGTAFCGNVGSPSRMEYCFVGDVVNMSARMMGVSCKKQDLQIVCCDATKMAACTDMSHADCFRDIGRVEVKGS
jgi:class 3 adenylate cyclase